MKLPWCLSIRNPLISIGDRKRFGFNPWGGEDPLKEEMATHSSVLAWKVLWKEEMGGLQSMGVTKSRTQLSDGVRTNALTHTHTGDEILSTVARIKCPKNVMTR